MKTLALAASLALVAAPLAAQGIGDMTDAERSTFRTEVRDYLLENPEVLIEAISVLEERQAQAEAVQDQSLVLSNAEAIFESPHDWEGGNPDGDIVLVEFMDYRCGYCRRAQPDVERLVSTDGNIRYIVKEFPILGPASRTAAEAALAAMRQDDGRRYLAFNDALMAHDGQLSGDVVWEIADEVGLDVDRLRRDAGSDEVASMIDRTYSLARALRIEGTPTFVIGDRLVRGYVPLDRMRAAVAEIRAEEG